MSEAERTKQALLVYLKLSDDEFGDFDEREAIFALEDRLIEAIASKAASEYDGHEFGEGFGTLYMYAPNVDHLFDTVMATLREYGSRAGSYVVKRYGGPGSSQERIDL